MIIMEIFRKFEKIFYLSSGYPSLPKNCLFNKSLPHKGHFFSGPPPKNRHLNTNPSLELVKNSTKDGFWVLKRSGPCVEVTGVEITVTAIKHQSPLLRVTEKKVAFGTLFRLGSLRNQSSLINQNR